MNRVLFILLVLQLVWVKTKTLSFSDHQLSDASNVLIKTRCVNKERLALLDFKAHILRDPRGSLSTWRDEDEEDCCEWSGVTCTNHTGHVTDLDLGSGSLEGEISSSLFNLTYLTSLNLYYNSFHGTVPMSIGSLTELTYLDLSENSFSGTLPDSIGSLTKLEYLILRSNSFNGPIPRSIGSLSQLTNLYLDHNSFNGIIPNSIGSLTELRSLDLSDNSFCGTIPREFANLTNLRDLSLRNLASCKTVNLISLSSLSQLESLDMQGTSLSKENDWVNVILNLKNLTYLGLSDCDLSNVMYPYSLTFVNSSSSPSIATLDLSSNNLNSSIYHWLYPLTNNSLITLDLSNNKLDGIPKYLGNLCSLVELNISDNSRSIDFSDFLNDISGCTSKALQYLYASNGQFIGSLSDDIQKFSSLEFLIFDHNQLNGTLSEKVWELPKLKVLDFSSNYLRGGISQNIGKSTILDVVLFNNSLEGVFFEFNLANRSNYVESLDMSFCKLGPRFPIWVLTLKNLTGLDIANNGISDTIPRMFWKIWPSQLVYLNLSSNNIRGEVQDLLSNYNPGISSIDLSSNNFSGPIQNVSSSLVTLNLSKNRFDGGILFLCQINAGGLTYLDLSNNSFTGKIPDCLWHFKSLKVLNLGNNNISGKIPASFKYLTKLEVLSLYNNRFFGEFPLSLRSCTKLTFLDLGANMFSGNVPVWIGESLSGLYVISLSSNNFFGNIPLQLCRLINLQVLDLSMNNLNGTIPSCFGNLTSMVHGVSPNRNLHNVNSSTYVDHTLIQWQGNIHEFSNNLGLLMSIDLSNNNLTGHIPDELTNLYQLVALNLSKNALIGEIPRKIGEMGELLTLDLSRNNLSGGLPSSLSRMTSLNYLDMSYNNLSGRIPTSTQLQSFEPSRYAGNAGLCGLPVTQPCPGDKGLHIPPLVAETSDVGEDENELERWFYIGGASGFVVGFWIACIALLFIRRIRHAFFRFLDILEDWVFVKVVLFKLKLRRVACP